MSSLRGRHFYSGWLPPVNAVPLCHEWSVYSGSNSTGLYFSDHPLPREQRVQAIGTRFVLPPNTPEFALQASHSLDENIVITGVRARMNYRGKKMRLR